MLQNECISIIKQMNPLDIWVIWFLIYLYFKACKSHDWGHELSSVIIHYVFLKGSYRRSAYSDSSCPLKNTHTHTHTHTRRFAELKFKISQATSGIRDLMKHAIFYTDRDCRKSESWDNTFLYFSLYRSLSRWCRSCPLSLLLRSPSSLARRDSCTKMTS